MSRTAREDFRGLHFLEDGAKRKTEMLRVRYDEMSVDKKASILNTLLDKHPDLMMYITQLKDKVEDNEDKIEHHRQRLCEIVDGLEDRIKALETRWNIVRIMKR